jgi:prepilin-type N-terminal cleavage/methylation domain-containing protein
MLSHRRAGFTLPDLLIAMVLLALIATVAGRMLLGFARTLRGERERANLETAFDAALGYFAFELSDVSPADLQSLSPDSMEYRATRTTGLACLVAGGEVRLLTESLSGLRQPQAGRDSLLLYVGRSSGAFHPDWVTLPILAVGNATCDTQSALRLATTIDTAVISLAVLPALVPVATFERMQVRLYQSLGATWLGARSVSAGEAVQPLAGPFDAPGPGLAFLDSTGNPTSIVAAVRQLELTLLGRAAGWNGAAGAHPAAASLRLSPSNLQP